MCINSYAYTNITNHLRSFIISIFTHSEYRLCIKINVVHSQKLLRAVAHGARFAIFQLMRLYEAIVDVVLNRKFYIMLWYLKKALYDLIVCFLPIRYFSESKEQLDDKCFTLFVCIRQCDNNASIYINKYYYIFVIIYFNSLFTIQ